MNTDERTDYDEGLFDLSLDVSPPSYSAVLEWMRTTIGRRVTFDYWARGNFTRRLIHHRQLGVRPLVVAVNCLDEIRLAYRRLALMGLPVDFVYCGADCSTERVLHLCPTDIELDSGWGYIAALGSLKKLGGREWFPVIGQGHMLPESIIDWLVEEAGQPFLDGQVFIAPAEVIGIDHSALSDGLAALSGVTRGALVSEHDRIAQVALSLDLPYLDGLNHKTFAKFLAEHEGELERFRHAFRKLVLSPEGGTANLDYLLGELRHEIAELTVAEKHRGVRARISRLGGAIATFTASLAVATKAEPGTALPLVGVVGAGLAGKVLFDLWRQSAEQEQTMAASPYIVLWKLGVRRPSQIKATPRVSALREPPNALRGIVPEHAAHHWLCPPTGGLRALAVKKPR